MKTESDSITAVGVFRPDEVYTFAELRRRGFGSAALREMQRNGLLTRESGRQKVVLGSDLLDYFANLEPVTL